MNILNLHQYHYIGPDIRQLMGSSLHPSLRTVTYNTPKKEKKSEMLKTSLYRENRMRKIRKIHGVGWTVACAKQRKVQQYMTLKFLSLPLTTLKS